MSVFIPFSILKAEFGNDALTANEKTVILRTARQEIATPIKGENIPSGTSLLKGYTTSNSGAKRLVFLLRNTSGHFVLLFYRSKGDPVGKNITLKNPAFKKALKIQLTKALKDILDNRYLEL